MYRGLVALVAAVGAAANTQDPEEFDLDKFLKEEFNEEPAGESRRVVSEESARRDFDEFDINRDGQLDPHEIRSVFVGTLSAADVFTFYETTDKDHSGTVSWPEYLEYVRDLQKKQ